MSDFDKAYIFDSLMRLSIWEVIDTEKSMRWWIVLSIWTEAVQLENKASSKKWKPLKVDIAPMVQPMVQQNKKDDAPNPSQTKPIQVKPNQIISIDTEQAPTYWKEELNMMQWFLRQAVWVTQFKDSKERWYVQHCYNLMKNIWKDEFNFRLQEILSDSFKQKNSNKLAYLYWELKSYIHSPVVQPKTKESALDITL